MSNRFALGTAQFGMDYGINNKRGRIPDSEVYDLLRYASSQGIDTLDTANGYGDSETVIGTFSKGGGGPFNIISKYGMNNDIEEAVNLSLHRLGLKSIYGYLAHDFKFFSTILKVLSDLKSKGKIKKIGVSVYYPQEIESLWEQDIQIDLVQLPFSVFDQRFLSMLPKLKEKNIEVHARSIFLQGLVFKNANDLQGNFLAIKEKLASLSALANQIDIPLAGLCINFVLLNQYIDKVIIGVDGLDNLKENLEMVRFQEKVKSIYPQLSGLAETNENLILPFNWKK
jgi:aryl-alcohol dehydrogenase-like predicted oxidoreductase